MDANVSLDAMHEFHGKFMTKKGITEPIRRLTVELPESEYRLLEDYCLARQESKRQVIRSLIRRLRNKAKT